VGRKEKRKKEKLPGGEKDLNSSLSTLAAAEKKGKEEKKKALPGRGRGK